jgi:hypothetical protein
MKPLYIVRIPARPSATVAQTTGPGPATEEETDASTGNADVEVQVKSDSDTAANPIKIEDDETLSKPLESAPSEYIDINPIKSKLYSTNPEASDPYTAPALVNDTSSFSATMNSSSSATAASELPLPASVPTSAARSAPLPLPILIDQKVYYVPNHSTFLFTSALRLASKGSDASNVHDEEVDDREREFSDDEEERAWKKRADIACVYALALPLQRSLLID